MLLGDVECWIGVLWVLHNNWIYGGMAMGGKIFVKLEKNLIFKKMMKFFLLWSYEILDENHFYGNDYNLSEYFPILIFFQ